MVSAKDRLQWVCCVHKKNPGEEARGRGKSEKQTANDQTQMIDWDMNLQLKSDCMQSKIFAMQS